MSNFRNRIRRLEDARPTVSPGKYLTFTIEGPCNLPEGAAVEFLRRCGHLILDDDVVFVCVIRGMNNDGVFDLPLRDITGHLVTEEFRETAPPAPILDRVPTRLRFTFKIGA
ncbi:hypothetical protein M446_6727 [Methylobacterium sp. 4-46]|uniref:hypothetical protein n=1 Tax=unclassified Methylobacterium TaxID=2615210 RepID=UPI000165CD06|nr:MULTISPECIES: hypothetical protein [Methylobacterium]ACA20977.1 hypothetical protein M446_6727 [Methylobacterium sp. 4-46]WFT80132.1 hypothetical protein QA634_33975 [Methylobacterium nodulans]